jgi:hypothetical protein
MTQGSSLRTSVKLTISQKIWKMLSSNSWMAISRTTTPRKRLKILIVNQNLCIQSSFLKIKNQRQQDLLSSTKKTLKNSLRSSKPIMILTKWRMTSLNKFSQRLIRLTTQKA